MKINLSRSPGTEAISGDLLLNTGQKSLAAAAALWLAVAFAGQLIFVVYILRVYGRSALMGEWEKWNAIAPHGYTQGDAVGNISFGMHVLVAALVSFGGPLQLIPRVRRHAPAFHRWNGRLYGLAAVLISLSGFYLSWVRGSVGGTIGAVATSINGVLILIFACQTIRFALQRQFSIHRKWALRLYLAMSGVFFFRIGLMFWLLIHQRPAGFDPDTFEGPFLTFLNFAQYLLPLAMLEGYFWAREKGGTRGKYLVAAMLAVLTLMTAAGVFGATMGLWAPLM